MVYNKSLGMKITLTNVIKERYNFTWEEVSNFLEKYQVLELIDISYEMYCSIGIDGILLDIKDFVEKQGGRM